MHLAIDARIYSPRFTGVGRYTHEITKQLFQLKPDWEFTLFLGEEEFKKFTPPSKNVKKICAPEPIYSASEQISFLKKLNTVNADLTWFPHFTVPLWYRKKFVVTVHDLTLSKFPGKKMNSFIHRMVYFAVLRNALNRSEKILTVSQNTKNDIVNDEKITPQKIEIAGNAVGEEFFNFVPQESITTKYQINSPFFLYTGQHREHKNLLGMAKGFHQFLEQTGADAQLVVTGKENPLYPEFWDYIKKHNLEDKVRKPGLVPEEDLIALYAEAKAYIFPSFYEGFGIPPLEAMATKTPVIASNSSCIPEICGEAALYFYPAKPEELAEQITALWNNPSTENELIEKGNLQVKKYSWENSVKKILKVFEESLSIPYNKGT